VVAFLDQCEQQSADNASRVWLSCTLQAPLATFPAHAFTLHITVKQHMHAYDKTSSSALRLTAADVRASRPCALAVTLPLPLESWQKSLRSWWWGLLWIASAATISWPLASCWVGVHVWPVPWSAVVPHRRSWHALANLAVQVWPPGYV
jgi:hypothetical protein